MSQVPVAPVIANGKGLIYWDITLSNMTVLCSVANQANLVQRPDIYMIGTLKKERKIRTIAF